MARMLAVFLAVIVSGASASAAESPAGNSVTFRLREILNHETLKPFFAILQKDFPGILSRPLADYGISPSEMASITVVNFAYPDGARNERSFMISMAPPIKPMDVAAILKSLQTTEQATVLVPAGSIQNSPKLALYETPRSGGLIAVSDRRIFSISIGLYRSAGRQGAPSKTVISPGLPSRMGEAIALAEALEARLLKAMESSGELIAGKLYAPSIVLGLLEDFHHRNLPPAFDSLSTAQETHFGFSLKGRTATVGLRMTFSDAAAAAAGKPALVRAIALGNAALEIAKYGEVGSITPAVQIMDDLTASLHAGAISVDGAVVNGTFKLELAPEMEQRIMQAVMEIRVASERNRAENNIKQIMLGLQNHNDQNGGLPENIYSKDGKTPLLSWRVQILPFVEQEQLYRRFKLDEPWDSEHNKQLIPLIPRIYQHPLMKAGVIGGTFYQGFVGKPSHKLHPWLIEGKLTKATMGSINAGNENPILVAEAATAVAWTKPEDIAFDPEGPRPAVAKCWPNDGFITGFADGTVKILPGSMKDDDLKRKIQVHIP